MGSKEKERRGKKWLIIFGGVSVSVLMLIAGLVIYVDPFFHYHKPLKNFPYILDNQITQNPGLARNMEYNSVLLGSSMVVPFESAWFEELMGLRMLRMPYNAACPKDQDNILKIVEEECENLKEVYLGIDLLTYTCEVNTTAYPIEKAYYNQSLWDDAVYLWNMDVLLQYIIKPLINNDRMNNGIIEYTERYEPSYYAAHNALRLYSPSAKAEKATERDAYIEACKLNMEQNILPYIERNPDTKFTIFFPPYSMLFWNDLMLKKETEARMKEYEVIMESLFSYDNVQIFFFPADLEIICDLNNYKDYSHYSKEVCRYMTECFQDGTWRVTEENYQDTLAAFEVFVEEYDYIWK